MSYNIQVHSSEGKVTTVQIIGAEGTERIIDISPNDQVVVTGLNGQEISIEVKGNDLIIHCEGEQDIQLRDFYAIDRENLPTLYFPLQDGCCLYATHSSRRSPAFAKLRSRYVRRP